MQDAATIQRLQMENEALRCKLADQEQRMCEQSEAVKGQEQQQVVNLEQQVDGLHSKVKDEQQGKAAAVMVSSQHSGYQQVLQKLPYCLLSCLHVTTVIVTIRKYACVRLVTIVMKLQH